MSDPAQIGGLLYGVLADCGLLEKIKANKVFFEWHNIVGERVANYAGPVKFDDQTGELWIAAKDPCWRTELFNMRTHLIQIINDKLGVELVKKIRIV